MSEVIKLVSKTETVFGLHVSNLKGNAKINLPEPLWKMATLIFTQSSIIATS